MAAFSARRLRAEALYSLAEQNEQNAMAALMAGEQAALDAWRRTPEGWSATVASKIAHTTALRAFEDVCEIIDEEGAK